MGICASKPIDDHTDGQELVKFTAKSFIKQRDTTEAYRKLVEKKPNSFLYCVNLSYNLYDEALMWRHSKNPNRDLKKAESLIEESFTYINRCITTPKEQWRAYNLDWLEYLHRGDVYMALGKYKEALADFGTGMQMAKEDDDTSAVTKRLKKHMQKSSIVAIEKIKWLAEADLEAIGGAEEVMDEAKKLDDERCQLITKSVKIISSENSDSSSDSEFAAIQENIQTKGEEIYKCQARVASVRAATIETLSISFNRYDDESGKESFTKYREGFVATWTEAYNISLSVKGGVVSLDTSNIAVDVAAGLCSLFPWGGNVIGSGIKVVYEQIKTAEMKQKANIFLKIARDSTTLDKISNYLALKLAISNKEDISDPKTEEIKGWFRKFIAKVKEVAHDVSVRSYGERFEHVEEQLGQKHAQSMIAYISSGKFEFYPQKTLIARLEETFALGKSHGFEEFAVEPFGFEEITE